MIQAAVCVLEVLLHNALHVQVGIIYLALHVERHVLLSNMAILQQLHAQVLIL